VLREGFNVTVILSGVKLQVFAAEFAGLPVLIDRMLQEIFRRDCGIQPGK
jgi:hypothetical protein